MIKADLRQLKRFEKDLVKLSRKALPYATKQAVNDLAWQARREWQHEMGEAFTLRNRWTQGSVRVKPAKGLRIKSQRSIVGSLADYVATQESGGRIKGRGEGRPVPTLDARAGKNIKQLVRRPNQFQNIKINRRRTGSQSRQNAARIRKARMGSGFAYIEKGSRRGVFKVGGGKKRPRLTLIQNLSKSSVRLKPRSTMKPAVKRALKFGPRAYQTALTFQLHRLKTFKR